MNYGILLSGGVGTRVGGDIPKQYLTAGNQMIITYSLKMLLDSPEISAVVIICEAEYREQILKDAEAAGMGVDASIHFALPGRNRQESILHGLQVVDALEKAEEDATVFIHDAARPGLTEEIIRGCYEALGKHDGVMPVLPMKDTVYLVDEAGKIESLLPRERVVAGQAPELFRFRSYLRANEALLPERILTINGSTEPAILAGLDVITIPGDERNFKITTKGDLERFQNMYRSLS